MLNAWIQSQYAYIIIYSLIVPRLADLFPVSEKKLRAW